MRGAARWEGQGDLLERRIVEARPEQGVRRRPGSRCPLGGGRVCGRALAHFFVVGLLREGIVGVGVSSLIIMRSSKKGHEEAPSGGFPARRSIPGDRACGASRASPAPRRGSRALCIDAVHLDVGLRHRPLELGSASSSSRCCVLEHASGAESQNGYSPSGSLGRRLVGETRSGRDRPS